MISAKATRSDDVTCLYPAAQAVDFLDGRLCSDADPVVAVQAVVHIDEDLCFRHSVERARVRSPDALLPGAPGRNGPGLRRGRSGLLREIPGGAEQVQFHIKRKHIANPFLPEHLFFNESKDFFVCPMGQHMAFVGKKKSVSDLG